jgi:hypothetical protein
MSFLVREATSTVQVLRYLVVPVGGRLSFDDSLDSLNRTYTYSTKNISRLVLWYLDLEIPVGRWYYCVRLHWREDSRCAQRTTGKQPILMDAGYIVVSGNGRRLFLPQQREEIRWIAERYRPCRPLSPFPSGGGYFMLKGARRNRVSTMLWCHPGGWCGLLWCAVLYLRKIVYHQQTKVLRKTLTKSTHVVSKQRLPTRKIHRIINKYHEIACFLFFHATHCIATKNIK